MSYMGWESQLCWVWGRIKNIVDGSHWWKELLCKENQVSWVSVPQQYGWNKGLVLWFEWKVLNLYQVRWQFDNEVVGKGNVKLKIGETMQVISDVYYILELKAIFWVLVNCKKKDWL